MKCWPITIAWVWRVHGATGPQYGERFELTQTHKSIGIAVLADAAGLERREELAVHLGAVDRHVGGVVWLLRCCGQDQSRTCMKVFIPALALAILITASAFFAPSANAARRSVPRYDQERTRRVSDGSWQCYPYCQGGTYQGRPVREWLRPGGW
jgi:hypothetical protein